LTFEGRPVRRILIRANNWIGDVVMISPAVRAIRAKFGGARIAILGRAWVVDTLRGTPFYDDLLLYDDAGRHRGLRGRLRLARELRRERFDLAVLFQKAFEAAALAWLARIPVRVGYATDARWALLTHALPPPRDGGHHVDAFLGLARYLDCPIVDRSPTFHVQPGAREAAAALVPALSAGGGPALVAIHPGASKAPRAWHPERFSALADRLVEAAGASIVLLGAATDRPLLERIAAGMSRQRAFIPPPQSIGTTAAILERCRLFVGNDSGPMHLAAAVGTPVVGIFGPGDPRRTAPVSTAPVAIVGRDYPCAPCRQDFFRECPPSPAGKPFCLEEIAVDDVAAAALRLLRGVAQQQDGRAAIP
jgi:heptosyltransferase-2